MSVWPAQGELRLEGDFGKSPIRASLAGLYFDSLPRSALGDAYNSKFRAIFDAFVD